MRYNIHGFDQLQLRRYKISHDQALILRWIVDFSNTKRMINQIIEDKIFYLVKYRAIINDLPILEIVTEDGIRRHFVSLEKNGIISRILKKTKWGTDVFIHISEDVLDNLLSPPSELAGSLASELADSPPSEPAGTNTNYSISPDYSITSIPILKDSKSFENDHSNTIEILHKIIPSSNFKGTWPKPGKPLFKKLKQSIIFLESLYSHKFFDEYAFGSKKGKNDSDLEIQENRRSWFKKHKIDPDKIKAMIGSWEELERVLKRAIRVWEDVKQPGYWPLNKTGLTQEFNDWIYNPRTGFSWFLYCLCNPAERLQDMAIESVMEKIPEIPRKNAEIYLKAHPEWDAYNFWNKASLLWAWMQKNKQRLSIQNTAYEGTCGNFRLMFQCFSTFEEELTCGGKFQLNNFGIDCPTWVTFCSWMKKNYGVSLQIKNVA